MHLAISTIPTVGDWHVALRLGLAAILGAAIGMACGAGWYGPALITTLFTILALGPLRIAAYKWMGRFKPEENRLTVELKEGQPVGPFLALLDDIQHFELTEELDRRVLHL